MAFFNKVIPR